MHVFNSAHNLEIRFLSILEIATFIRMYIVQISGLCKTCKYVCMYVCMYVYVHTQHTPTDITTMYLSSLGSSWLSFPRAKESHHQKTSKTRRRREHTHRAPPNTPKSWNQNNVTTESHTTPFSFNDVYTTTCTTNSLGNILGEFVS